MPWQFARQTQCAHKMGTSLTLAQEKQRRSCSQAYEMQTELVKLYNTQPGCLSSSSDTGDNFMHSLPPLPAIWTHPGYNLCEYTVIPPGVRSPFVSQSHRSAASGHCTARELQAHTALPEGKGEPDFCPVQVCEGACHLCNSPSLHSYRTTQCTFLTEPRVTRSGCQPCVSLAFQSH